MTPPLKNSARIARFVRVRARFAWLLTSIILSVYFGFIAVVAFDKSLLALPLASGATSIGIPIGIGIILLAVVLTAIYVWRANREFDPELAAIIMEYRA